MPQRELTQDVDAEPGPGAPGDAGIDQAAEPHGRFGGWTSAAVFVVAEALLLAVIRLWQPRFFYIDDKLAQYIPVWHWLGRQPGLALPVIDPDQGSGGNFVGDLQYGVLDPFHWLLATAIGHANGLNAVGWGLHVLGIGVLGLGIVTLARHYRIGPLWAAAAALGAANSGFLLWFGASWWPAVWGTALLPWLWWGMVTRARVGVLAAALAAYLVGTSGYPYALPFAGLVVVAAAIERWREGGRVRAIVESAFVVRLLAAAGGLLLTAPGLLAASAMTPYSQRAMLDVGPLGSTGDFIPNLVDVVVGGPTLNAAVTGWWGTDLPVAVMATGWFAYPALALVDWRRFRTLGGMRAVPGGLVCVILIAGSLVASQLPTVVGGLRYPFRYAVIFQLVVPLFAALLASRAGLLVTRGRIAVAAAVLLVQGLLAVSRTPYVSGWHVTVAGVGVLVLLSGLLLSGRRRPLFVAVLLVATVVAPLVSIGAAVTTNNLFAENAGRTPTGLPANMLYTGNLWPADVASFRARAVQPGLNATVLVWGDAGPDRGLGAGVPVGSAALFSDMRTGFGYTSVGQEGWSKRWCQDFLGQSATCRAAIPRLLALVPGTDRSWLDVTSKDILLVDHRSPPEIVASLRSAWRPVGDQGNFSRFERRVPTPGRITVAGSAVTSLRARTVGTDSETYDVAWTGTGDRRLITRIPWWPGYWATLNGHNLPVRALDGTALTVDLPPGGGHGQLRIYFQPPGHRAGLAAVAVGVVLILGAAVIDLRRRRRRVA